MYVIQYVCFFFLLNLMLINCISFKISLSYVTQQSAFDFIAGCTFQHCPHHIRYYHSKADGGEKSCSVFVVSCQLGCKNIALKLINISLFSLYFNVTLTWSVFIRYNSLWPELCFTTHFKFHLAIPNMLSIETKH